MSSWYCHRGHLCRHHRGRPWDHLCHRGHSCRVRQRRRPGAAPAEPSRDATPALAVLCPPAPPSQSPVLQSSPPPMSVPPSEICTQDTASSVLVFAAADATGVGPAATSADRAATSGEPLPVASRASPVPYFGYVPSQQCGMFPLLQSCHRR
jgi:hypothetical protein